MGDAIVGVVANPLSGRDIRRLVTQASVFPTAEKASADRIIPAAQAGSVAGADVVVVDGAGHMPHMERPAKVQAAIEETVARAG